MIEILKPGGLTSIQDLGRPGQRAIGVGVSGAMDPLALAAGNLLVGNEVGAAGLEVALAPFCAVLEEDTLVAVTGADFKATVDGWAMPPWWVMIVKAGQRLELQGSSGGGIAYVCFRGGLDVPVILGSRSTDQKGRYGGLGGRALGKGDRLRLLDSPILKTSYLPKYGFGVEPPTEGGGQPIRVIPAAEYEWLEESSATCFWDAVWTVSADSNRMGFRLSGPHLKTIGGRELLSHGILPGVVQLPPSGQPIVQMCDANTSGGYPKLGVVIGADLRRLAQTPVRGQLRFTRVDRAVALAARSQAASFLTGCSQALGRLSWQ